MSSPFVVISTQRSGSTLLINYLDQHPKLTCAGEIFKKDNVTQILNPEYTFDFERKVKLWHFNHSKGLLIKKHLKQSRDNSPGIFGFKLMVSQIDQIPIIMNILNQLSFKKIVLKRSNHVAQTLSMELARETGNWIKEKNSGNNSKPKLSIEKLDKTLRYFQRCDGELSKYGSEKNSFVIEHENLVHSPKTTLSKILKTWKLTRVLSPKGQSIKCQTFLIKKELPIMMRLIISLIPKG